MSVVTLVLTIAIIGFIVWLILQIPMPQIFRQVLIAVISLVLVLWVLQGLGLVTGFPVIRLK